MCTADREYSLKRPPKPDIKGGRVREVPLYVLAKVGSVWNGVNLLFELSTMLGFAQNHCAIDSK